MTTKTMNWKCPHCGGTTGTYFEWVDICKDCGKGLREPTIKPNLIDQSDTPRTDAVKYKYKEKFAPRLFEFFSKQLERELAASKAEVERLEEQLNHFDDIHCDCVPKLKAEVEKLKAIDADMRNFLAKAIHNEGFNEDQALKFIYQ
jgi:hypothetical protein